MSSAIVRKSVTDLSRRKARAFFTVLTLALAVASVGLFAVPGLMQQAMDREIASSRLSDVTLTTKPSSSRRPSCGASSSCRTSKPSRRRACSPHACTSGLAARRRWSSASRLRPPGGRRRRHRIRLASTPGALLSDTQNAAKGKFDGSTARIVDAEGRTRSMPVSGEGRSLMGGANVANGFPTFYARTDTVEQLSGSRGFTTLGLRLDDPSRPAAERTIAAVRAELNTVPGFEGFAEIPQIRQPGDYPYKEGFENISSVMTVVTLLALLSALVLLSNTMSTLIGEQTARSPR
jgi:hypothetical protein